VGLHIDSAFEDPHPGLFFLEAAAVYCKSLAYRMRKTKTSEGKKLFLNLIFFFPLATARREELSVKTLILTLEDKDRRGAENHLM
jgi:hypothetical protein